MIEVTESARQELKKLLSSKVDYSYARLRLIDRGQVDLGLGIDVELPGDEVVEHDGSGLLVVESELAASLDKITLDFEDSTTGAQLVIIERS